MWTRHKQQETHPRWPLHSSAWLAAEAAANGFLEMWRQLPPFNARHSRHDTLIPCLWRDQACWLRASLSFCISRDLRRDALFLWMMPFWAALSRALAACWAMASASSN